MATKSKAHNPLSGMHTAGIFSDMSIDGPEIGTLVLIVDRAKNLPNRKTIGKQDPYCAARLGKEAKKTSTDIRGGQTPKWDQELRFTVHDSPDYFQLKLSVFNDDKKTELIGETWIDLRDIIVQGGGQSDQWHGLTCRGKYAGNIRIEITYYDARPKPEKIGTALGPLTSTSELDLSATQRLIKRRPLPSDPVTGQAPAHTPEPAITPARVQPKLPSVPIPNQSLSQATEYKTPPPNRHPQPDHHSPAHGSGYQYAAPAAHRDHQLQRGAEVAEGFHTPQYEPDSLHQSSPAPSRPHEADSRAVYSHTHPSHITQPSAQPRRSLEDSRRPPPPPAHRVRNSGGHQPEANAVHRGSYELVRHGGTPPMRHDVLRSEAHRSSVPSGPSQSSAYPGRPTYRPYDSAPNLQQSPQYNDHEPNHSASRHHSYDSTYDAHRRPMQPTVEDVPESWTPPQGRNRGSISQYDELEFDMAPVLASSNPIGHENIPYEQHSPNQPQSQARYEGHIQNSSPSPLSSVDYSQALMHIPRSQGYMTNHYHQDDYDPLPVPSTLIPGIDPNLAHEAAERLDQDRKKERRYTQPTQMVVHSRSRQHSEPPVHYDASYSHYSQLPNSRAYEGALVAYSGKAKTPPAAVENLDHRRISPSPATNHTIKRKSVSPAPPPSEPRRLSGVPFGPDSYDAFNPSASTSRDEPKSANYTNADGKIVTPDGREVDPSDHLPMETWAPEPDQQKPVQAPETRSRPVLNGAQPMPPSGRRQLRIAARPHSMALTAPTYARQEPTAHHGTERNRLQKKNHRVSALPAPVSGSSGPLGPATAHQRNSTPPRALIQASKFDYENHGPPFEGEYSVARTGYGSGPPIPAKVPMMSGGMGPGTSMPRGGEELALMEEMSRIDIGTGRARRHRGF
ncbi:putative C2 domain-containing protein [Rosellinia necatrix]|uniref:Putative C2 domain-containing protein n=1 Tax=Rosellinia necatrix TaxID=77044 RepID=A0A1S7UMQ3_ROSNE|nr:putative C2 domain-containing protein [Rosellinia necatrix]